MVANFDRDVLETAVQRKAVLAALTREPHHRKELQETLDLSKTTCHRIIRRLDNQGLLRRTEQGYELTMLGEIVYEQVETYETTIETAYELQPLLAAFATANLDFDIGLFEAVKITKPEPGNPYPFVDRQLQLLRETDVLRVIDHGQLIPPTFLDEAIEIGLETGTESEFIVTEEIAVGNMEVAPDRQREVAQSADTTAKYFVHDAIPFGMGLYDAYVDFRVYDENTGTPILFAEVDDPDDELRSWAETVYQQFRSEAIPATTLEDFPDWAPNTGIQSE